MKKGLAALLLIIGIASAILGIICYGRAPSGYTSYEYYGGDAYTGIQQAAADAANRINALGQNVVFGFGSVLLLAGLVLISIGIFGLVPDKKTRTTETEPTQQTPVTVFTAETEKEKETAETTPDDHP